MSTENSPAKVRPKKERRKRSRQVIYTRYQVLVYSDSMKESRDAPAVGLLTDISAKGLGVILDRFFATGTTVFIVLEPNTARERELVTTLIWRTPLPSTNKVIKPSDTEVRRSEFWRLGLRLNDNKEQMDFIEKLLARLRSE